MPFAFNILRECFLDIFVDPICLSIVIGHSKSWPLLISSSFQRFDRNEENECYFLVGAFRRKTQTIVVTSFFLRPTNWQIL